MKKTLVLCVGFLFLAAMSGCSLGEVIDQFTPLQNTDTEISSSEGSRVYMDEIRGTLKDFTGNKITLTSGSDTYTFDVSQATLECEDGMICGDAVSIIYEGQLNNTDTDAVRALKVVDDYHETSTFEEKTTHGQIQSLTANAITVKSKGGKTVTFPITGTEQYYQSGLKTGLWVYLHYKGEFGTSNEETPDILNGSHMKIFSISDIDPLTIPSATPTPVPTEKEDTLPKSKMRAIIQNIQTNILQVSVENTDTILNLDLSATPCYFSGGITPGSHVTITYTGDFDGTTTEGLTILDVSGEIPENLSQRVTEFTISGEIIASTANTITLRTTDGINITCNKENASIATTGGLLSGSCVKVTFNPADSRQTNIYTAIKIEDL